MNFIEVLNLALDALELSKPAYMQECVERHQNAITALNAAITEMEKQEPVAWCDTDEDGEIAWDKDSCFSDDPAWFDNPMPLYAHPAPAVEKVEPVLDVIRQAIEERDADCDLLATERHELEVAHHW